MPQGVLTGLCKTLASFPCRGYAAETVAVGSAEEGGHRAREREHYQHTIEVLFRLIRSRAFGLPNPD